MEPTGTTGEWPAPAFATPRPEATSCQSLTNWRNGKCLPLTEGWAMSRGTSLANRKGRARSGVNDHSSAETSAAMNPNTTCTANRAQPSRIDTPFGGGAIRSSTAPQMHNPGRLPKQ